MRKENTELSEVEPAHYIRVLSDPWYRAIVSVEDEILQATNLFWRERGARCLLLPITTGSISSPMGLGSDSTPVMVDIMGTETYLADSMQFGLEYACRLSDRGAFYVMPSFRGEASDSTHLSQFFHSEAEIPGGLENIMLVVEQYLKTLVSAIAQNVSTQLFPIIGDLNHILKFANTNERISRISFDQAAELLAYHPRYVKRCTEDSYSLTREGEQKLMQEVSPILWVTHFHHGSVPFYQAYDEKDNRLALAADLLMGPGEIVGCGERHSSSDQLSKAIASHQVDARSYEWYVKMKEHFPLRTAGFGLGIERLLMWLFKHDDIRDFQIMPRINGVKIFP